MKVLQTEWQRINMYSRFAIYHSVSLNTNFTNLKMSFSLKMHLKFILCYCSLCTALHDCCTSHKTVAEEEYMKTSDNKLKAMKKKENVQSATNKRDERKRDFLWEKGEQEWEHQLLSAMLNELRQTAKDKTQRLLQSHTDEEVQYPGSSGAKREAGAEQLSSAEDGERSWELFPSLFQGDVQASTHLF